MLDIPFALREQFEEYLQNKLIPNRSRGAYKKWLRYYLDFCRKYNFSPIRKESLPRFVRKLQGKKQTKAQQRQAVKAIMLYYEILKAKDLTNKKPTLQTSSLPAYAPLKDNKHLSVHDPVARPIQYKKAMPHPSHDSKPSSNVQGPSYIVNPSGKRYIERENGASWEADYSLLEDEIHVRHYSSKTLKTYKGWVRKFQTFTSSKTPELLSSNDVKEFLTFLAVKRKVASSTQNQAFNALLFFYRHILHKEFGKIDGVVRAKRKPYIPEVLSREEIEAILKHLEPPYDLVIKLLYGCGLRLSECLGLRVHCMNFDAGILTVHDGKGQKDRTVPLPEKILPELRGHLESLKDLHKRDLKRKYAGVFLVNALEQKYKNAAKEFIWQWFFPAKQLTREKKTGEYRRYHLHGTHVQKAIARQRKRPKVRLIFDIQNIIK